MEFYILFAANEEEIDLCNPGPSLIEDDTLPPKQKSEINYSASEFAELFEEITDLNWNERLSTFCDDDEAYDSNYPFGIYELSVEFTEALSECGEVQRSRSKASFKTAGPAALAQFALETERTLYVLRCDGKYLIVTDEEVIRGFPPDLY